MNAARRRDAASPVGPALLLWVALVACASGACRSTHVVHTSGGTVRAPRHDQAERIAAALAELSPCVWQQLQLDGSPAAVDVQVRDEPWNLTGEGAFSAGAAVADDHAVWIVDIGEPVTAGNLAHELVHVHLGDRLDVPPALEEGLCEVLAERCVPDSGPIAAAERVAHLMAMAGAVRLHVLTGPERLLLATFELDAVEPRAADAAEIERLLLLEEVKLADDGGDPERLLARVLGHGLMWRLWQGGGLASLDELSSTHAGDHAALVADAMERTGLRDQAAIEALMTDQLTEAACLALIDGHADDLADIYVTGSLRWDPDFTRRPLDELLATGAVAIRVEPGGVELDVMQREAFREAVRRRWPRGDAAR